MRRVAWHAELEIGAGGLRSQLNLALGRRSGAERDRAGRPGHEPGRARPINPGGHAVGNLVAIVLKPDEMDEPREAWPASL